MLKQMIGLIFSKHFTNLLAFQGIEFLNVALIIFLLILMSLSYVSYKLYKATKQKKSIAKIAPQSEGKEKSNQVDRLEK